MRRAPRRGRARPLHRARPPASAARPRRSRRHAWPGRPDRSIGACCSRVTRWPASTACGKLVEQPSRRGLAGTAGGQVADTDHRHRRTVGRGEAVASLVPAHQTGASARSAVAASAMAPVFGVFIMASRPDPSCPAAEQLEHNLAAFAGRLPALAACDFPALAMAASPCPCRSTRPSAMAAASSVRVTTPAASSASNSAMFLNRCGPVRTGRPCAAGSPGCGRRAVSAIPRETRCRRR